MNYASVVHKSVLFLVDLFGLIYHFRFSYHFTYPCQSKARQQRVSTAFLLGLHSVWWCVWCVWWCDGVWWWCGCWSYWEIIVFVRNVSISSSWPTTIPLPLPHPPPLRLCHFFRLVPLLPLRRILCRANFWYRTGFASWCKVCNSCCGLSYKDNTESKLWIGILKKHKSLKKLCYNKHFFVATRFVNLMKKESYNYAY